MCSFCLQSGKFYTCQNIFTRAPPMVPITMIRYAHCSSVKSTELCSFTAIFRFTIENLTQFHKNLTQDLLTKHVLSHSCVQCDTYLFLHEQTKVVSSNKAATCSLYLGLLRVYRLGAQELVSPVPHYI